MRSQLAPLLLLFIVCLLIGVALMLFLHEPVSHSFPIGADFYPRYVGAHAFWQGRTPYSEEVTALSQQLVFRGQNPAGLRAFAFYYPAHLAVLLLPFIWLPIQEAGVLWSAGMWALLATSYIWWSWQLRPRPSPLVWGLLVASLVLFRPSIVGVLSGQFAPLILAGVLLCCWLIKIGEDGLAGMALLLATLKPSLAILPVLLVLVWALRWRRWNLVLGFGAAGLVLAAISFIRIGWWLPDLLQQMLSYAGDSRAAGLAWSPEEVVTPLGFIWLLGTLLLSAVGLRSLWIRSEFPWMAVFAGSFLNLLVTPHVYDYDLMMLLLPLLWLGKRWCHRPRTLVLWLCLVWAPLLFSVFSTLGAQGLFQYQFGVWLFYPGLLAAALLLWEARDPVRSIIQRILAPRYAEG